MSSWFFKAPDERSLNELIRPLIIFRKYSHISFFSLSKLSLNLRFSSGLILLYDSWRLLICLDLFMINCLAELYFSSVIFCFKNLFSKRWRYEAHQSPIIVNVHTIILNDYFSQSCVIYIILLFIVLFRHNKISFLISLLVTVLTHSYQSLLICFNYD